jgi:hypothetical protein
MPHNRLPDGYRLEVHATAAEPAFRDCVAYVLTMEGARERQRSCLDQLRVHAPAQETALLYNRGYRSSRKPAWVRGTRDDLWHANLTAMDHFLAHSDRTFLLLLEDDVQFLPAFREHARGIEAFLRSQPDVCLYNLGCVPLYARGHTDGHYRVGQAGGAHAVLYSRGAVSELLRHDRRSVGMHDLHVSRSIRDAFTFRRPLAIQDVGCETDNRRSWPTGSDLALRCLHTLLQRDSARVYGLWHRTLVAGGVLPVGACALLVLALAGAWCIRARRRSAGAGVQREHHRLA